MSVPRSSDTGLIPEEAVAPILLLTKYYCILGCGTDQLCHFKFRMIVIFYFSSIFNLMKGKVRVRAYFWWGFGLLLQKWAAELLSCPFLQ